MATDDLVNSVQKTISNTHGRISSLETLVEDAEGLAKQFLKRANDLIEEAKIYKSQLRNEKILLAESVSTLSTLLVKPKESSFAGTLRTTPQMAEDLEAALNG